VQRLVQPLRRRGRRDASANGTATRAHFADQYRKFLLMHEQQRALRAPAPGD
jgi:hypothetical protein